MLPPETAKRRTFTRVPYPAARGTNVIVLRAGCQGRLLPRFLNCYGVLSFPTGGRETKEQTSFPSIPVCVMVVAAKHEILDEA